MKQRIFNKRIVMTIVVIAHLLILGLFSVIALTTDEVSFIRVSLMKPVQFGYDNLDLDWIGYGRDLAHSIVTICGFLVGALMVKYGSRLRNDISQFFITMIGIQVMFGGFLNLTLLGLVFAGGFWHLLSLMVVGCEAASVMVTTLVMLFYWKSFVHFVEKQDALTFEGQS